ncbi:hypothetical protein B0I37DRAFT_366056 [Chaetomium sp. MPI-CAGE-AT-0009]|nr:hypothetical protein B0I37DRAFT_366056 [Chaetomium sp. MPI-CAGE-AT-0009]
MAPGPAEIEESNEYGDIEFQNDGADYDARSEDELEEGEVGEGESSDGGEDGEISEGDANDDAEDEDAHAAERISMEKLEEKLKEVEFLLNREDFVKALGSDPDEQRKFLANYERYISIQPPLEQDNVLHVMASRARPCPWLIRHVLKYHKERMDDKDNARRRPLTLAIEVRKELFIKTVLESKYDDADLERILGINSTDMGTGIHTAIVKGLSSKLTIELIRKVSDGVLSQKDGAGCTPLHRAVEYERCTPDQIQVVRALLKRGDSALDVWTNQKMSVYQHHLASRPKANTKRSTAQPAADARRRGLGTQRSPVQADPMSADKSTSQNNDKRELEKNKDKTELNRDKKDKNTHGHSRTQTQNGSPAVAAADDPLLRRPRRTMTDKLQGIGDQDGIHVGDYLYLPPASLTTYQANERRKAFSAAQPPATPQGSAPQESLATITSVPSDPPRAGASGNAKTTRPAAAAKKTSGKDAPKVKKAVIDTIAREVKLQYLRSTFTQAHRNHDTAVDFLYGESQTAKQICFSLLDKGGPVQMKSLKFGNYSKFEFDSVLQVVAIGPNVTVRSGEQTVLERGRKDLVTLFKWLKDKKVKNIIKVIVVDKDINDSCHSDEAIIDALSPFSIEILDWNKPDLCPETIKKACESVRELHLSWSGLNGMLLAWGGADGLASLPNLTDIYLRQTKYLETDDWTSERLAAFETRLGKSRKCIRAEKNPDGLKRGSNDMSNTEWGDINVHRPATQDGNDPRQVPEGVAEDLNKDPGVKDHQWLEIMDEFAKGIFKLKPDDYIKKIPNLPADLQRDVRICLIDDGVDAEHKSISERMDRNGKAFGTYPAAQYRGMTMPFYDSTTNHGTLMASMIVRVCPYAKIVSYRLDTRKGQDGNLHFTPKSAVEALNHAAKQDFDIISMSWTVKKEETKEENNSKDIGDLVEALEKAAKKKLIFCCPPDKGDLSPDELAVYFPIGSGVKDIFRIGAAKADNSAWLQAGHSIVDYILPGHEVRDADESISKKPDSFRTGSSVATALAAGLAGLVIHVVRMAAIRTHELGKENDNEANLIKAPALRHVKLAATMRKTFDSMKSNKEGELYVHVWKYFRDKGYLLKAAGEAEDDVTAEAERWRIVSELALQFCRV